MQPLTHNKPPASRIPRDEDAGSSSDDDDVLSLGSSSASNQSTSLPPAPDRADLYHAVPGNPIHHPLAPAKLNLPALSNADLAKSSELFVKEYAELAFNQRVLHLALDKSLPLLDRFKFVCIVSSNLDEQFAKRLGNIPKVDDDDEDAAEKSRNFKRNVRPPSEFEEGLSAAVADIVAAQYDCLLNDILPALKKHGIEIVAYKSLSDEQKAKMRDYFTKKIYPLVTPLSVDQSHPFPLLASHGIYLVVTLLNPETSKTRIVYFRIPPVKPRCIPVSDDGLKYVLLEDVVLENLDMVCYGMEMLKVFPFRVTRNVKLVIDDVNFGESDNLLDFIWEETHRRRSAPATRLEVSDKMPKQIQNMIAKELFLDSADVYTIPGRYLGLAEFFSISFSNAPHLKLPVPEPKIHPKFAGLEEKLHDDPGRVFSVIRKRDILVQFPIHSFASSTLLFMRAAARDPKVRVMKCVLYRSGDDSPLVAALIRAAKSGKDVSVLIELKASFDEVQNSEYARRLQKAGVNVSYGLVGLKTHSKTMLVVREEDVGFRCYVNIATGNFNPGTAKLYTDLSLFTCREDISADVLDLFNALTGYSRQRKYRRLLVAPVNMLDTFCQLIDGEAEHARRGVMSRIVVQVNGLSDKKIAEHLYAASQAGVQIDLIIRGICCVVPGLKGKSENIRVFSWVGNVLQHRRIFYFSNAGKNLYYIGSADWRARNLNDRVEVIVPVDDKKAQLKLRKNLMFFLEGSPTETWEMGADGKYYLRKMAPAKPAGQEGTEAPVVPLTGQGAAVKTASGVDSQFAIHSAVAALPPTESGSARWSVTIDGKAHVVGSLNAGCVPVRERPDGTTEVLMITGDTQGQDKWVFAEGGLVEDETYFEAAERQGVRMAGVKGSSPHFLGWFIDSKHHVHKAIAVVVLAAKGDAEDWAEAYLRKREWLTFAGALNKSPEGPWVTKALQMAETWAASAGKDELHAVQEKLASMELKASATLERTKSGDGKVASLERTKSGDGKVASLERTKSGEVKFAAGSKPNEFKPTAVPEKVVEAKSSATKPSTGSEKQRSALQDRMKMFES